MYGGDLMVKPMLQGDEMTLLEIHYTPGVGAPLHVHECLPRCLGFALCFSLTQSQCVR